MITKQFQFRPTDDPAVVTVTCAAESEWDVDRAVNLLRAAPVMYDAVGAASQWLHRVDRKYDPMPGIANVLLVREPNGSEMYEELLDQLRNAEAAAVGSRSVK